MLLFYVFYCVVEAKSSVLPTAGSDTKIKLLESRIYLSGISLRGAHTGISSNNDDDGNENITKEMDLRPFKLYRVDLKPHNSSNVGEFSWSWILNDFIHAQIAKGQ